MLRVKALLCILMVLLLSIVLVPGFAVWAANLHTNKQLIQGSWYCPPKSAQYDINRFDFNSDGTLVWLDYKTYQKHKRRWVKIMKYTYSFITPTKIGIGGNNGLIIEKLTANDLRFKEISLGKVYPYACDRTPPPGDTSASRAKSLEWAKNQRKLFLGKWETADRKNYVDFLRGNRCIKGTYEDGNWKAARRKFDIFYNGKSAMCGNNGMFSYEGPNKIVLDNGMGGSPVVYRRATSNKSALENASTSPGASYTLLGQIAHRMAGKGRRFTLGDYFVYSSNGHSGPKVKFAGTALVKGRNTWIFKVAGSSTAWVDQDTGVLLKSESQTHFAVPQRFDLSCDFFNAVENDLIRTYNFRQNRMNQVETVVDTYGKRHLVPGSYQANYNIYFITHKLKIGEWYPWKTSHYTHRVTGEKTISVPAGTFTCWIITHIQGVGHQYYKEYFDKNTGILIEEQNWVAAGNGKWKMIGKSSLNSFKLSTMR